MDSDVTSGVELWQMETETLPGGFGGDTVYVNGSPVGAERVSSRPGR